MSDWQPIETAPKDGREILARGRDNGIDRNDWHEVIARWHNGRWIHTDNDEGEMRYLREWRPLPG